MLVTTRRITALKTPNYKTTLVVIDSGVPDYQILLAGVRPKTQVLVLDQQQDGITQITATISKYRISSLQLIADGSPGSLRLGKIALNLDNLHTYQQQLQQWQVTDILIYGCEVAAGEKGKAFLNQLHQLTGASIAASTKKVGNSHLGGSWELGVNIGQISSSLEIKQEVQENYPHVLADINLAWAKKLGGNNFDGGVSIAVDSAGNIYTTGFFEDTVDFDSGSGTFNLTSNGVSDIFISKLNSNGSFAWSKQLGGTGDDLGNGIVVDNAGNIYTTGYFEGTVDFDPGSGTFNLTSSSDRQNFISKLNSDGSFAWAKNFGGFLGYTYDGDEKSLSVAIYTIDSIAVDSTGNVYTTGFFEGTVDFDPGSGTFNLTSNGSDDIFISKLNSDGSFAWAKSFGSPAEAEDGFSIAVDSMGNVYTIGSFAGTVDFDPGSGTFNLTSNGFNDIFISKLNSDGSFAWAKNFGGSDFDSAYSIAVDSTGNVFTTGVFRDTADFDPGSGTFNLTSNGESDIFISKLNSDGSFAWAKSFGGSGEDTSANLAVDSIGNVYTTGFFEDTLDFDPGIDSFNLTSNGGYDIFISKLNSDGSFAWAKSFGGSRFFDLGMNIALDTRGNIYTTGLFMDTVDFDPSSSAVNLTSNGEYDIFISKLGSNQVTQLVNIATDVFQINSPNPNTKLQVSLTGRNSSSVNELIVFSVDDDNGTINGIAPGAAGYTQAVIARSTVIFSAIANVPNGFSTSNITRTLEFDTNTNIRFALVKGATLDAVKAGSVSSANVIFSSSTSQSITTLSNNVFALNWRDGSNSNASVFNDLVVNVQATDNSLPTGTKLQDESQGEVIDLTGVNGSVAATFTVNREAAFDNYVGFYRVTDANGGIDINNDGVADFLPGQAGYLQAAINQRVAGIDLTVANQGTATYTGTLAGGGIFAPFIIVNGRPEVILDNNTSNDPAVYFPYLGANADGADHIRLLGDNIFGFEDLPNLGDADYNDVIVKVNLNIT